MSRTPGGVQKVCSKKVCALFSFPINREVVVSHLKHRDITPKCYLHACAWKIWKAA